MKKRMTAGALAALMAATLPISACAAQNSAPQPQLNTAEHMQYMNGYTDGTFRPEGRITRQQLAAILFRYLEHRGADTAGRADLSRFSDTAAVADYAREAMAWAVSAGLLQGRSDGTLDPAGSATRAQTAVILQRLGALLEEA